MGSETADQHPWTIAVSASQSVALGSSMMSTPALNLPMGASSAPGRNVRAQCEGPTIWCMEAARFRNRHTGAGVPYQRPDDGAGHLSFRRTAAHPRHHPVHRVTAQGLSPLARASVSDPRTTEDLALFGSHRA